MASSIIRTPALFGQSYSMATLNAAATPTASGTLGGAIAADTAAFSSAASVQAQQMQAIRGIEDELAAISQQIAAIQAQFDTQTPATPAPAPQPAPRPVAKPAPKPVAAKPEPKPKPEPKAEQKPAPKPAPEKRHETPKPSTYTVQAGDSLSRIAARALGDGNRWREIFELNRDQISDPNSISPGQTLKLPTGAHAPSHPAPKPASAHGPNKHRGEIYMTQPNGWTCGPTSLTMAAAAFGLRSVGVGTVDEMVRRTGTTPDVGIPNRDAIPGASKQIGLHCNPAVVSSPAKVREALKAGHGVIQNGSLGSGGHYIYLAGLNSDGSFIVCDPARSSITSWNDSELTAFMNREPGHDIMFEVWR